MDTLEIQHATGFRPKTTILRLNGALTLATLFDFQDTLRKPGLEDTIIDLSEVPYMDSAGLGAILSHWAHTQRNKFHFAVAGPNDRVKSVFDMTKVTSVLPIFVSAEEAEQSFA